MSTRVVNPKFRRKYDTIELTRESVEKVEKLQALMGENLQLTQPGLFGPGYAVNNVDFVVGAALDHYIRALEQANAAVKVSNQ